MRLTARTPTGLAYEAAGSGPDVLLMHSGISDSRMWDPQWPALSRALPRDPLRRARLRLLGRPYGARTRFTATAMEVLDALDVEKRRGRWLLDGRLRGARHGDRPAPSRERARPGHRGTPSGWTHSAEIIAQWEAVDAAYESRGIDAANELEMKMWLDGPFRAPDVVDREIRRQAATVNRVLLERQATFEIEPGDLEPPAIGRLAEVQVPTLVITGELDQPSTLAGSFEIARGTGAEHVEIAERRPLPEPRAPGRVQPSANRLPRPHA